MEVEEVEAGRRIVESIKRLDIGSDGQRGARNKEEALLDADTLMTNVAFQKALLLIPALFEPAGRKGICSYSLKHRLERMIGQYLSNAQATVAFAYHGFEITKGRNSINYNIKCQMKDIRTLSHEQSELWKTYYKIITKFPVDSYIQPTADYSIFSEIKPIRDTIHLRPIEKIKG